MKSAEGGEVDVEGEGWFSAGCGGWGSCWSTGGSRASDDVAAAGRSRGTEQAIPGASAPLDVDRDGLLTQR